MMIKNNIFNLLENVIVEYLDCISIIKLEMTCKRFIRSDEFWVNRLQSKFGFEAPENKKAKHICVMLETNMLFKYLKYFGKTDIERKNLCISLVIGTITKIVKSLTKK